MSLLSEVGHNKYVAIRNVLKIPDDYSGARSIETHMGKEDLGIFELYEHLFNSPEQDDTIDRIESLEMLSKYMEKRLTKREYLVISNYYGLFGTIEKTMKEIGDELNVTRARIDQIVAKSLRKLRYPYTYEPVLHGMARIYYANARKHARRLRRNERSIRLTIERYREIVAEKTAEIKSICNKATEKMEKEQLNYDKHRSKQRFELAVKEFNEKASLVSKLHMETNALQEKISELSNPLTGGKR